MRKQNAGTTTVEFAIIAVLLLTVMFAIIEFGRTMFTLSVLSEGTRRGARLAAVCPIGDPMIVSRTQLVSLPGFRSNNVVIEYLNQAGAVVANPAGNFSLIQYVRVRIVGYSYQTWIPFMNLTMTSPEFASTFPKESLGVPRSGVVIPCD